MNKLLQIEKLSFSIKENKEERQILSSVSMSVNRGELIGLVGSSGSGKSILLRSILGLHEQLANYNQTGQLTLYVNGEQKDLRDTKTLTDLRSNKIGIIWQQSTAVFNPSQKLGQQLIEKARINSDMSGSELGAQILASLDRVGLNPSRRFFDSYPHQLSGGQIQRALIALALINEPVLLLADEPFSAVNEELKAELMKLFKDLSTTGMTILMASHNIEIVKDFCDRVYTLKDSHVSEVKPSSMDSLINSIQGQSTKTKDHLSILFELKNIYKAYKVANDIFSNNKRKQAVLENFSLKIYKGEILGLCGPSGSGKSTIGRLLLDLESFSKGELVYENSLVKEMDKKEYLNFRMRNQIISQDALSAMSPHRTVEEILHEVQMEVAGVRDAEQIEKLMASVNLSPDLLTRLPVQLSGGERQRVMIVRALILEASFLVCDEILSSLDATVAKEILKIISKLNIERGLTVLFITHDKKLAKTFSHRIIELDLNNIEI